MTTVDETSEPNYVHVYPTFDHFDHVCIGLSCPCRPEFDKQNPLVVVHNEVN